MLIPLNCSFNRGDRSGQKDYSVDCILTIYTPSLKPRTVIGRLLAQFRSDSVNQRYPWKCLSRADVSLEEYTEEAWAFTLDFKVSDANANALAGYIEESFGKLMKNQNNVYVDVIDIYPSLNSSLHLDSSSKDPLDYEYYWTHTDSDSHDYSAIKSEVSHLKELQIIRGMDPEDLYSMMSGDLDFFYEHVWKEIRPILQRDGFDMLLPHNGDHLPKVVIYNLNPKEEILDYSGDDYFNLFMDFVLEYNSEGDVIDDLADRMLDVAEQAESDHRGLVELKEANRHRYDESLNSNRPKAPKRPKGPTKAHKPTKPRKPTKPTKPHKPIRPDKGR